ncbi:MAG: response regulator [Planctomycetota bacterium]
MKILVESPRILIADDDEVGISVMTAFLTQFGAKVTAVSDGQAAVEQAMIQQFDLIVLDIEMPVLDGISACRQLNGLRFTHDVPVLMLTGNTDKESVEASFEAGAGDYLNKPIYPALLWRRICNLLELRELKRNSENLTSLLELSSGDNCEMQTVRNTDAKPL